MGLSLEVGYLADLLKNDSEGAQWFQEDIKRLNGFLTSVSLQPHSEPPACQTFSCDMYGYSGLHYLRRIAAHLDLRSVLPPPGKDDPSKDPLLAEYYRLAQATRPGFLDRLFHRSHKARTFDHLLLHSDSEGYYLPQDFESVLFPPNVLKIPGTMVGSSNRLHEECQRLADALGLPLDLDPEEEIVWNAAESQGEGETQWQRYGIESFTCLRLYHASEHSLKNGAAIVFC